MTLPIPTQTERRAAGPPVEAARDHILEIDGLRVAFETDDGVVHAVDGFSLHLERGKTICVVGESGCGKSVTAKAMLRLLPDNSRIVGGKARFRRRDGSLVDITAEEPHSRAMRALRGRDMAIIFQEPMTALSPVHTIGEQITEMIRLHQPIGSSEARGRAAAILERAGIPKPQARLDAFSFQLSGGMRQRAMIAIALANRPEFLIADEPTTALDVTTQAQILDLLRELRADYGMSMMFITHDLGVVAEMADEVAVMYLGTVVERARVRDFFRSPRHPYSMALLRSTPSVSASMGRLATIEGSVPSLLSRPTGCAFHTRCPSRIPGRCDVEAPPDVALAGGTVVRCWLYASGRSDGCDVIRPTDPGDGRRTESARKARPNGPLLAVRGLKMHFGGGHGLGRRGVGAIRAVDGIDLDIAEGETVGIVGESGSGKTTLGKSIIRIHEPTAGSVTFHRRDGTAVDLAHVRPAELKVLRRDIRLIFQDPYSSLNPRATVGDIIAEPLVVNRLLSGAALGERVCQLLERVGLPAEYRFRYPHAFSGGQRQRIGIARAMALNPRLVICDEAVSALDVSVQAQVLNLLADLQGEFGFAYLFIAHDLSVVRQICRRTAVMYLGRIVESADTEQLFDRPAHPYTEALLSAVPIPDPDAKVSETRIVLEGEIPDPSRPPSGCPFHTRCRYSDGLRCVSEVPAVVDTPGGGKAACHYADRLDLRGVAEAARTMSRG